MTAIIPYESGYIRAYKIYRTNPKYPGLHFNEEYFIHLKDAMNSILPYWEKIPESAWTEDFDSYTNTKFWTTNFMETNKLVIEEIMIDIGDE